MPLLSAVVHLDRDPHVQLRALAALTRLAGLTPGLRIDDRLPVVLESGSRAADRALWQAVQETPGVVHVELVFADFSDLETSSSPSSSSRLLAEPS